MKTAPRTAIVLFNLGGPDSTAAVKPFLFNLFNDPAIINLPNPFRWRVAKLISGRREQTAIKIYNEMGGRSPIVPNTEAQAKALAEKLGPDYKCFLAMRYWHPRAADVVRQVQDYNPDRIILLPLYPQFSTTTTASSAKEWRGAAARIGLSTPTQTLCCYPTDPGFVAAAVQTIRPHLRDALAKTGKIPRLLLSAHGLPEKIVAAGDPYQWQCEQSAAAIIAALENESFEPVTCYQSRVGPLKWIGPSTEDEVKRAGQDGVPLVVAPLAFVSDHSETLVELDIEYRHLAEKCGVPFYARAAVVGTHVDFIAGLARLVQQTLTQDRNICSQDMSRICPHEFGKCPHRKD